MSDRSPHTTLEVLRSAFDASFAARVAAGEDDRVALLAIRVGRDGVAARVHDTAGILRLGQIVAVPSRRGELLGLVGVRGAVVPVYSLAKLTARVDEDPPRWAILAGHPDRVALAFAAFEGHLLVAPAQLRPAAASMAAAQVAGGVELDGGTRPILDVPAIVRLVTATGARGG